MILRELNQKDDLLKLKSIVEQMKEEGINFELFKKFYYVISPKLGDEELIQDRIREKGLISMRFYPQYSSINGSYNFLDNWSEANKNCFEDFCNVKDTELFKLYLKLYAISHEVEHAYQKLCASGIFTSGSEQVNALYRYLFDLYSKQDTILPHPIRDVARIVSLALYKKNENQFFVERNANVESFDFVSKLALECNDEEIYEAFHEGRKHVLPVGYIGSNMGSVYDTYKNMKRLRAYKFYSNQEALDKLSDEDRVRLGLPISEDVREAVLNLKF